MSEKPSVWYLDQLNSRVVNSRLKFVVDNRNVNIVNQIKYLGCIFSDDFSDMLDIKRCFKSFNKSVGFLLRNFFMQVVK